MISFKIEYRYNLYIIYTNTIALSSKNSKKGLIMRLPTIWSQGQIFAFSALDGHSPSTKDFAGILSADKIGIRFFTKTRRELALVASGKTNPVFHAVTGDWISIQDDNAEIANIIYADAHLIIGNTIGSLAPIVMVEGASNTFREDDIQIHDTLDGDFTALGTNEKQFAFAYGGSAAEAKALVSKGLSLNIENERNKKIKFYESVKSPTNEAYAPLYYKCLSLMKTQLYSPEGNFKRIWSTPDRLPHKYLWLWDSVFHAIGFRNFNGKLAEDLILAIFDNQRDNGFISHLASVAWCSDITQPPVIAWGAHLVYQKTGNANFLRTVFEKNKKFLLWCQANRRDKNEELYTWYTGKDVHCRCDESGMDNSPRFDTHHRLQAIDFSCFMANEARYMKIIASVIGDKEGFVFFSNWYDKIKTDINAILWCEEDGFYYDFDTVEHRHHKIQSVASFLPLFSGICDSRQAQMLYKHLTNPETFYTEFSIPSISKKDKTFGSDMWRGPVWINYNYMISIGLREFGFTAFADEIEEKTVETLNHWYKKTGVMFEFYDCENKRAPYELNRKGEPFEPYDFTIRYQSIRDYGWSTTLLFDLLNKRMGL